MFNFLARPFSLYFFLKQLFRRYKNAIVVVERGDCYFNHKVVHAQRVGAAAVVVINYSHEKSLFMPDIDTEATLFQPEPVTIPLVMMLHHHVEMILRHGTEHRGVRQG